MQMERFDLDIYPPNYARGDEEMEEQEQEQEKEQKGKKDEDEDF
jgi:hypothetical protein